MSKIKNSGQSLPYLISQNFLTGNMIIRRLLNKTTITNHDTVLEIGAGKGHITRLLSERCKNVIAYEIDRKLYDRLLPELKSNVRLYCADFLKAPLPKTPYKVFSNIPFSITTDIIRKLTLSGALPSDIWLVMEKGAAKRFCGLPCENLNSLLLKPFFETRIIYYFSKYDFHPAPKADIVLLEFTLRQDFDILPDQRNNFAAFLRHSMKYGLYGPRSLLTKKQISAALRFAHLPPIERSDNMLYVQWLCLFRCWLQYGRI